jgi:hypothetical protein
LPANRLGHADITIQGWQQHEGVWVLLELAANTRVFRMNVACVRHEAGRQRANSRADLSAEQRAIRLDVLSRVCVISVPADVLADIPDPAGKVPIEVDEGDFETLRQKSTDRALAGSTGADQSNLLGARHVTRMIFRPRSRHGTRYKRQHDWKLDDVRRCVSQSRRLVIAPTSVVV